MTTPGCALCDSSYCAAAASMRELGAKIGEIATATRIDPAIVEKHFAKCIVPLSSADTEDGVSNGPLSMSDEQLETLLRHSLETYHSATIGGNLVAATASLSVRLRALSEQSRRAGLRSEAQSAASHFDPHDPDTWTIEQRQFLSAVSDAMLEDHDALVDKRRKRERNMRRRQRVAAVQKVEEVQQ